MRYWAFPHTAYGERGSIATPGSGNISRVTAPLGLSGKTPAGGGDGDGGGGERGDGERGDGGGGECGGGRGDTGDIDISSSI